MSPDITMCAFDCPKSKKCYRHEAKPSEYWQAFFSEEPWRKDDTTDRKLTQKSLRTTIIDPNEFRCSHFWPIETR